MKTTKITTTSSTSELRLEDYGLLKESVVWLGPNSLKRYVDYCMFREYNTKTS
jgi:hypothetical protein